MNKEDFYFKINDNCIEHKILHKIHGKLKIVYTQLKLVWPIDNRELVQIFTKVEESPNKVYLVNQSVNYAYP